MFEVKAAVVDRGQCSVQVGGERASEEAGGEAEDLPRLIHKAILARRFVEAHKHAARQCLRAARVAGRHGDTSALTQLLSDAREEHAQARLCNRYARDCEGRAEALGIAAGAYAASGRGGRLR